MFENIESYKQGILLVVSDWIIGKEHRATLSKRINTNWPYFVDIYIKSEHIWEEYFWTRWEAVGYLRKSGYTKFQFHKHGPSVAYGFRSRG